MFSSTYSTSFSINLVQDFLSMWQFNFMRNAFIAGSIIAVIAGIVGYFVVIRKLSFAAHALSHAGFTGAAGAVLFGINPLIGLLVFTSLGGVTIGSLGKKVVNRDIQTGSVLAFMLGLGVLFISLYKGYATETYSILFGQILGISSSSVIISVIASILVFILIVLLYRKFLFSSFDETVAEARGLNIYWTGIIFMLILAITTSIAVQIVGVLLIFALLVTPAAVAVKLSNKPINGMIISSLISLSATFIGLFISFYIPYPVSFFIISIVFIEYIGVTIIKALKN